MTTEDPNSLDLKTTPPRPANVDLKLVEYDNALERLGGDKELLAEFVEIVLCDTPKLMNDICIAIEQNDSLTLQKSAHALKGLMLNFGAQKCCDLALEFELAGRNNQTATVEGNLPRLKSLYQQLCDELKSL